MNRDLRTADPRGRLDVLIAQGLEQIVSQQANPIFGIAMEALRPTLHQQLRRNLGPRALPDLNAALRKAQAHPMPGKPRPKRTSPPPPKKAAVDSRSDALKVLGLGNQATKAEIAAAYREQAKQYHPDKVAGLAPAFQKLADEEMKKLNAAYAFLKVGKV